MKHVFLLRVCESENGYPLKDSRVYESENRELTIDDYLKIRSNGVEPTCVFYVGFGCANGLIKSKGIDYVLII